jgi:hypothetical protein
MRETQPPVVVMMPYKDAEKRRTTQRAYQKKWYQLNRRENTLRAKVNRKKRAPLLRAQVYAEFGGRCQTCGDDRWPVLVFHHLGGKEASVPRLITQGYSLKFIMKEARKCQLLCANCHIMLHHRMRLQQVNTSELIKEANFHGKKESKEKETLASTATGTVPP